MKKLLTATFVLAFAALAQAQAGGFGGGMRDRERIPWFSSIDKVSTGGNLSPMELRRLKAMGIEPTDKKFIFVYIRPISEDTEPRVFATCQDSVDAARGSWAFVKMDFDRENAFQKAWGVRSAPACIGCDIYANDFIKMGVPTIDVIRSIIGNTPKAVAEYEAKLKSDFGKATEALKTDEEKAAKLLVEICLAGKNGYKEVTESHTKLNDLTEAAFRKGELAAAVSADVGVEYFEDLVKTFRTTGPGAKAEIFTAILDHARGNVQPAIQRLLRVTKYDPRGFKPEIEAANKALDDVSKAGDAKIEGALNGPDKALAKEIVRKLAKEYAGTEAAKHANEAAK
jgi:thioredoxin-like negative regulator of GroEL